MDTTYWQLTHSERGAASEIASQPPYRVFVFHHTHWDREWWTTFQDFRIKLVDLVDDLLDVLDEDPEFHGFLLDGQTIVLRDYLQIRPENRERLVRALQQRRIECGPWFVLADQFLVSGEAHIRNLWLGRRLARRLDIPLGTLGYIPDAFGHIAQMPQILRGFGIDNAFVWRGRGGDPRTVKQEFLWEAPDGSRVLAHWFPGGYYLMPFLHFDNPDRPWEDKLGRVHRAIAELASRATTDALLLPYGGDHRPVDRNLERKLAVANEDIGDLGSVVWGSPREYLAAVRERQPDLDTVHGEMRGFGEGYPHVLPGVLSTRLSLKALNAQGQTWLERYAEPLSAAARVDGARYDHGLIWNAWDLLVQNHAHDSICGCSLDEVHRSMLTRFAESRDIARSVTERAAQSIQAGIDTESWDRGDLVLVAHNTLPYERSGWVSVWLDRLAVDPRSFRLIDPDGADVSFQARDVEGHLPGQDRWKHTEIGFVAEAVPGLGYRAYRLLRRSTPLDSKLRTFNAVQPVAELKGNLAVSDLTVGENRLENRYLQIDVSAPDGTLVVTDKETGESYQGLNGFEDGGDAGDAYNFSAPLNDAVLRSADDASVHVSVEETGYARATLRVDLDWHLPARLSEDRLSRSTRSVPLRISTFVSLASGARHVEVTTEWDNTACDHRLRALFPLGEDVAVSYSQGQFTVETRDTRLSESGNGWPELPVLTMPQQGWAAAQSGGRGLMIANRGLPEYEVLGDGRGTIALTLLRAVGWLSREDLLSRVGGAGPTVPVPDAQSPGLNRAQYAIIPFAGDWLRSRAFRTADAYLTPFYGSQGAVHAGTLPPTGGLIELGQDHSLVPSACKWSEDGDHLILRLWNAARSSTGTHVRCGRRVADVRRVDLKEEPVDDAILPLDGEECFFVHAGPAEMVTLAIRFAAEDAKR